MNTRKMNPLSFRFTRHLMRAHYNSGDDHCHFCQRAIPHSRRTHFVTVGATKQRKAFPRPFLGE